MSMRSGLSGSTLLQPHALHDLLAPALLFSTRPGSAKLSCLELHPVHPWALALSVRERDKDRQATQMLQVWDYAQKVLLREICLEDVDWQFDAIGGGVQPRGKRGLEIGPVQCLRFIDQPGAAGGVTGQRQWIAVLGQHRTLLLDLDAMSLRELSFTDGGAKKAGRQRPTSCVLVAGPEPGQTLLACALEEEIHLFSTQTWEQWCRPLSWKHLGNKKDVTHLVACTNRQPLVSGHEDGLLLLWDLARREVVKSSKAHEAGLMCVSYNRGQSQLVTSGKEGVIRTWALPSLEQQWEARPPDGVAHALHCRHSALALDALWLFRPDGEPTVWCMRGQAMENRAHRVLAVPKTATIHELAVHPLQPHLICMLTSAGLSVYRVGAHWPPSVAVSKTEVEPSRPIRAERRKATLQSVPPPALPTFSGRDRSDSGAEDFESLSRKGSGRAGSVLSGGSAGYNGSADFDSASASALTETLPITWTVEQVGTWLERIGLGRHKETFLENDVDGRLLLKLTVEEIQGELGVSSSLQAKKIVSKVERLQGAAVAAPAHGAVGQQADRVSKGPAEGLGGADESPRQETREAFFVADQSLLSVKFTAASMAMPQLHCEPRHKHMTLSFPGVTTLAFSSSGEYFSIVFVEAQRYDIYKLSNMRRLDSGHAIDLHWAQGGTQGGADRYAVLQSHEHYKSEIKSAVESFNAKPQKGIDQLLIQKKINGDPEDIARFLHRTEGLNMKMIGEYLAKKNEFCTIVLRAYISQLDFEGLMVDEAMRALYGGFIPPGEAQQIEHINAEFSDQYVRQNPDVFSNPGNVEFMGYAIMMLNTDLHNPNIEEKRRMQLNQFIRNTRSPDTESDPACSEEACTKIYRRIKANEIKLKTGDEGGLFLKAAADMYELPDDRLGHVVVKSLYQDDTNLVGYVDTHELVTRVHGGCMIGLEVSGGDAQTPRKPRRQSSYQWYDWQTLVPVGQPIPPPLLVEWDPDMRYCLTTYADAFYIWKTFPTFRMVGRFPGTIVAALWSQGRLLYSTNHQVCCLYPTHADEGPIVLATFTSDASGLGVDSDRASGVARVFGFQDSFCPPPQRRLPGALAMLAVVQDRLIMMDASNAILSLSLAHPAMRLRQLVVSARRPISAADAEQILELALQLSPGSEHDAVAAFLEQGFEEHDPLAADFGRLSLHLPGLSSVGRLCVCVSTQLFAEASEALLALEQDLAALMARQCQGHIDVPSIHRQLLRAHLVVVAAAEASGAVDVALSVLTRTAKTYRDVFTYVAELRSGAYSTGLLPLPPADPGLAEQSRLVELIVGGTSALGGVLDSLGETSAPPPISEEAVVTPVVARALPSAPAAGTPETLGVTASFDVSAVQEAMPPATPPEQLQGGSVSSRSSPVQPLTLEAGVQQAQAHAMTVSTNPFSPAALRQQSREQ